MEMDDMSISQMEKNTVHEFIVETVYQWNFWNSG